MTLTVTVHSDSAHDRELQRYRDHINQTPWFVADFEPKPMKIAARRDQKLTVAGDGKFRPWEYGDVPSSIFLHHDMIVPIARRAYITREAVAMLEGKKPETIYPVVLSRAVTLANIGCELFKLPFRFDHTGSRKVELS